MGDVYCIDFNGWITGASTAPPPKQVDFNSQTIPELIYSKAKSDRVAAVFDSEKTSLTFSKIVYEMESIAAGLLSSGLQPGDRILICGSNHSQVILSAFAASRAGLVFSLANPNFPNAASLHRALDVGEFQAIVCFKSQICSDYLNTLLLEICPELMQCRKGQLKAAALSKLSHVILAEEDHKHAGTYTLSEVFNKSSKDKIDRLPDYGNWSSHKLACLQFTNGTTDEPKLVALSHYQLLNGARAVVTAFRIQKEHVICCSLPIFRIPLFSLVCLSPFLTECRTVFPDASPLPRNLFVSVNKYQCTTLLSNGAALRLLLKISQTQKVKLNQLQNILLIGDRVSKEVLKIIKEQAQNVKIIAVGYLLTELGSIPIMGDESTDFTRNVGRAIAGYEIKLASLKGEDDGKDVPQGQLGVLMIRTYYGSTFMGYAPETRGKLKWIDTGDIARMDEHGNVEIVTSKEDLIFDMNNGVVEHWHVERLLNQNDLIKGCQIVSTSRGGPLVAVCVLRNPQHNATVVRKELVDMCRLHGFTVPEKFAFVGDFPRVHTRIQKYRIRQQINEGRISLF